MANENKFQYMLAPLEYLTDSCFRTICRGADMTFTELVRLESLAQMNNSALERIKLYDDTPTMIQIIGQKEDSLQKILSTFKPEKGFRGFNLNLGCPDPNFVSQGLGSAMIKRISKTKRLISIIKDHGYGANIKMRLGLNKYEKDRKVYLNLINSVDADFFVVHARHGKETYGEEADWRIFSECVKTGKTIIANGDIKTKADAEKMKGIGCAGVMIGRAAIVNPLIFAELKGIPVSSIDKIKKEYIRLINERKSPPKYQKNLFRYLGNNEVRIVGECRQPDSVQ